MYIKTADGELVKAKKDITVINLFNMTAGFTYNMNTEGFKKARELTNGKMDTQTVVRCIFYETALRCMPTIFRLPISLCELSRRSVTPTA